jgi:hypothetical protein
MRFSWDMGCGSAEFCLLGAAVSGGVDEAMIGCSYGLDGSCACASIEVRRRLAMTPKALGPDGFQGSLK